MATSLRSMMAPFRRACLPRLSAAFASKEASTGVQCGGFFFSMDPHAGLFATETDPNYRLTFTDASTGKSERVKYTNRHKWSGPHVECAIRMTAGYVTCSKPLPAIPDKIDFVSGWKITVPLCGLPPIVPIFGGQQFGKLVAQVDDAEIAIYTLGAPFGVSLGYQTFGSGSALKEGDGGASWKGLLAGAFLCILAVTCPWQFYDSYIRFAEWVHLTQMMVHTGHIYKEMDVLHDGHLTKAEFEQWMKDHPDSEFSDKAHIQKIMERFEMHPDGKLTRKEFSVAAAKASESSVKYVAHSLMHLLEL